MQYVDIYTGCTTRVHAVDVSRVWNSGTAPLGWGKRATVEQPPQATQKNLAPQAGEKNLHFGTFLAKLATILWELDAIPVPN